MSRTDLGRSIGVFVLAALSGLFFHDAFAQAESPPEFLLKWGQGGVGDGEFNSPSGTAVAPDGTVYVADTGNDRVQRFTDQGVYMRQWSTAVPGATGPNALDIAVDLEGNLYTIGDWIQKYDGAGTLVKTWLLPRHCVGIGVDGARGFVYATVGPFVYKYTTDGDSVNAWFAGHGGTFQSENKGIGVDANGDVYVMDGFDGILRVFRSDGSILRSWTTGGRGVGIDANDRVYVTGLGVRKFTKTGDLLTEWGSLGTGDGQFVGPQAVAVDIHGDVYVCDTQNDRVQKFGDGPTPVLKRTWGQVKASYRK